jgi:hypothetical protein
VGTVDTDHLRHYSWLMADFLTTSQIAQMYGLADSTVRHYRSSGRLVPSRKTPGGHARYAMTDVVSALGNPAGDHMEGASPTGEARITGLVHESFAPAGQHDLRSTGRGGMLASEVVALGLREAHDPTDTYRQGRARWGGRLLKARARVAA